MLQTTAPTSSSAGSAHDRHPLPTSSGGSVASAGSSQHPDSAGRMLVSKVLTYSDVSTEVARTGRIVLPRIQVQQCLPELLKLCQAEAALPALRAGGPVKLSVDLVVEDEAGRTWTLLMKTWQNVVSGEHRPTFVLENTADFVRANRLAQGDTLAFCATDGRMVLRTTIPADQLLPRQPKRANGAAAGAAAPASAAAAKQRRAGSKRPHAATVEQIDEASLAAAVANVAAAGRKRRAAPSPAPPTPELASSPQPQQQQGGVAAAANDEEAAKALLEMLGAAGGGSGDGSAFHGGLPGQAAAAGGRGADAATAAPALPPTLASLPSSHLAASVTPLDFLHHQQQPAAVYRPQAAQGGVADLASLLLPAQLQQQQYAAPQQHLHAPLAPAPIGAAAWGQPASQPAGADVTAQLATAMSALQPQALEAVLRWLVPLCVQQQQERQYAEQYKQQQSEYALLAQLVQALQQQLPQPPQQAPQPQQLYLPGRLQGLLG